MYKKVLTFILSLLTLTGCVEGSSPSPQPIIEQVSVVADTKLTRDYENTLFTIRGENITLDLNGHTIRNYTNGNAIHIASGSSRSAVINGTIESNSIGGGVYVGSCVDQKEFDELELSPDSYAAVIRNRCTSYVTISNMRFIKTITGVYVAPYTTYTTISNSYFADNERMAIYLDSGTAYNTIESNRFFDNGFRNNKGTRKRGHISVDGSQHNTITSNTFTDSSYKSAYPKYFSIIGKNYSVPVIEFYKNCGEAPATGYILPRVHGANFNRVFENTFNNVSLVAWLKYRDHDQVCDNVIYPDEANYNVFFENKLNNVGGYIQDDGIGNEVKQ